MGLFEEVRLDPKRQEREHEPYDPKLFALLREKRKEIANQANLPPYVIFHDRTLREMATCFLQTRDHLASLYGVGAAKLEKYGDDFLAIITEYCQTKQITERSELSPKR